MESPERSEHIQAAIDSIWECQKQGIHYPAEWRGRLGVDEGYRVQLGILAKRLKGGERHAGWKVGLTARAIQQQVNYHEPVFGYLLASGRVASGAVLGFDELLAPSFENELCLRLGTPLKGPDVTPDQAREAIGGVMPALEIVEKRGDFAADPALSMADNVQQRAFVTGPELSPPPKVALRDVTVEVHINGEPVDRASGAEVLGDPAASVAWLANRLHDFGRHLEPDTLVMTGSLTKQHPIAQGDHIEARFDPVGRVEVQFQ